MSTDACACRPCAYHSANGERAPAASGLAEAVALIQKAAKAWDPGNAFFPVADERRIMRLVQAVLNDLVTAIERGEHAAPKRTANVTEVPSWVDFEIDTDDVATLDGFDGVVLTTGEIAAQSGLRMSRETARALAGRLNALLKESAK